MHLSSVIIHIFQYLRGMFAEDMNASMYGFRKMTMLDDDKKKDDLKKNDNIINNSGEKDENLNSIGQNPDNKDNIWDLNIDIPCMDESQIKKLGLIDAFKKVLHK